MTVEELIELKQLIHSWEAKAPSTCERCWAEAQLSAYDYESVTDAYYAAMKRAEESGMPCTEPSPWRVCAQELEAWLKANESTRWHTTGRKLLDEMMGVVG